MCKKLIYLVSFICVLSIAAGAQAAPIPVSVDPSVEAVVGDDGNLNPNKSFSTYNLQVSDVLSNLAQGRRVTLISYDISGLKKDYQMFANMTLSVLGGNSSGKVDVYGVIEDQDNISSGLTWKDAPGVNNGQPIGYPVALDEADLTGKLLSFTSPARDVRASVGSAALDDFINSDTDGVVTLLLAPAKKGTNALMKSSKYSDGGVILEGEITTGINIIWVSQERDFDQDGVQDDQGFVDILNADGHNVDVRLNYWDQLDAEPNKVDELNAADLVIVSRATASGDYNAEGEATAWNSVTTPLIQMSGYLLRSSRWLWVNSTSIINFEAPMMQAVINNSPLFDGLELDADNSIDVLDPNVGVQDPNDPAQIGQTTFLGIVPEEIGNGVVLANTIDGIVWIAVWKAGVEFYDGCGQIPAGKRMMFPCGAQEHQTEPLTPWGAMNLSENGQVLLRNAIFYLAAEPRDAFPYTYDGDLAEYGTGNFDSLDGTWDRQNNSDAWDGTGPGDPNGAPGGAGVLTEDGVTFLRIQDIGDPRGQGFSDPSNRKIYLGHDVGFGLNGSTLEFRIRLATTSPLDGLDPNTPWPEGGDGAVIQDRGKGMVGIGEAAAGGAISFSLAKAGELAAFAGFEDVTTDVLVMNNLVGTEPSDQVDTGAGGAVAVNYVALEDATAWNTFTVNIVAGGTGTHVVTISVNGGDPQSFDVTVGASNDISGNYIAIGSSGTGAITAFDLDYITYK